eukprot:CAMPEP_0172621788 /NCGR_PEP_ID=MMETSP1068-20121228/115352_1 /TAXON_ID=35684 /ORGANISM="Pseudopedinella elastica, Strain CCMP716" /LENGTH=165 /DNA_ID=CAMNT_0013429703 /DNA_START=219 /DNA_END=713 /DNA_ORIENTATION=+
MITRFCPVVERSARVYVVKMKNSVLRQVDKTSWLTKTFFTAPTRVRPSAGKYELRMTNQCESISPEKPKPQMLIQKLREIECCGLFGTGQSRRSIFWAMASLTTDSPDEVTQFVINGAAVRALLYAAIANLGLGRTIVTHPGRRRHLLEGFLWRWKLVSIPFTLE